MSFSTVLERANDEAEMFLKHFVEPLICLDFQRVRRYKENSFYDLSERAGVFDSLDPDNNRFDKNPLDKLRYIQSKRKNKGYDAFDLSEEELNKLSSEDFERYYAVVNAFSR